MAVALGTLWILASLLALWGASLMWRGLWPRGRLKGTLTCPACRKPVASGLSCAACGFEGQSARDFKTPRDWRLVAWGWAPVIAGAGAGYAAEVVRSWFSFSYEEEEWALGPMHAMAVGVVLFALTLFVWSWRGDRLRGRRRCPKCWYDMSGSKLVCPECGHDAKLVKRLYRARRRKAGIVGACLLLVVAYGVWVVPRVRVGGPIAAVPTWVLIAGLAWWPDWMTIEDVGNYDEDWTLLGRVQDERLWQPEQWLLRKRARGIVASGPGVWALSRAVEFLDEDEDKDLAVAVHLAAVKGLTDAKQATRERAAEALTTGVRVPREKLLPFLPGLMRGLDDTSSIVQTECAYYLGHLGEDGAAAVPKIIECARRGSAKKSFGFGFGLFKLARESTLGTLLVLEASHDEEERIRLCCAFALGSGEAGTRGATERLLEMLSDQEESVASMAARSLCLASAEPDIVIPALLEWAEGGDSGCFRLPYSLDRFGIRLQPYIGRLGRKFLDAPESRRDALYVLGGLVRRRPDVDLSPVLDRICTIATSGDSEERPLAMELLGAWVERFGPPAQGGLPDMPF